MGKITNVVCVTAKSQGNKPVTAVATEMLLEEIQAVTCGSLYTITQLSTTSHYNSTYGALSAHTITAVIEYTI